MIRSLALGEVTPRDRMEVLLREWGVGLIKGGPFGLVLGLIAWFWKGSPMLGLGLALPEYRHRGLFDRGAPADGVAVAGERPGDDRRGV